jgi:hypothetical protein
VTFLCLPPLRPNHQLPLHLSSTSNSDPEFIPPSHHVKTKCDEFTLTLNTKDWIKKLTPHADRAQISAATLFRFCVTTIQAGGADLENIQICEKTIRKLRTETEKEKASKIRVRSFIPKGDKGVFQGVSTLPKVLLEPAMPYDSTLCGRPPLKWLYSCFRGSHPQSR